MKKIAYLFSATAMIALATLSSCKKDEETVDNNPEAPVVTSTMTTANGGNTGTAIASLDVTTSTGTAKIRLEVTSTVDLDRIYVMKSEDNGTLSAISSTDIVTSAGTFSGGSSDYTLKVPGSTKSFTIDIPVSVRTSSSAVTDVYVIWISNGTGSFLIPTKKRVLGPAVITLKYTAAAPSATYTSFSGTVGNQQAAEPSFIVTSGQGGVIGQALYKDDTNPEAAKSVDISFATLDGTGAALGTNPYLVSPNIRTSVGFSAGNEPSAANVNTTYFGTWSGTAFASASAADLGTITGLSATKIAVSANTTYAFTTQAGKKGLIQVGTISASGSGQKFTFNVKVLN